MKLKKISVIIAAYNEEPRIGEVLKAVERHPLIDEVIVINDGSADKTAEVVKKYHVTLVENEKNIGKTLSVKRGVNLAKNDLIMLLDADLVGIDEKSLTALAKPVLDGDVDWSLSIRKNSIWHMKLLQMDWISGERVLPKQLLADPLIWSRPEVGFGLETLMNKSLLDRRKKFRAVYLPDVEIINKSKKIGFYRGWLSELKMVRQIGKVMPFHMIIFQYFRMAYLNRKYKKTSQRLKYREA